MFFQQSANRILIFNNILADSDRQFDYDGCIKRLREKHTRLPEFKLRVWGKMLVM